jgi:hypothetical protein
MVRRSGLLLSILSGLRFDFDAAIPEIARINAVPERWMSDDKAVDKKRQARAQAQAKQQAIQAMPSQAFGP